MIELITIILFWVITAKVLFKLLGGNKSGISGVPSNDDIDRIRNSSP